jgi:hypothetical protein
MLLDVLSSFRDSATPTLDRYFRGADAFNDLEADARKSLPPKSVGRIQRVQALMGSGAYHAEIWSQRHAALVRPGILVG